MISCEIEGEEEKINLKLAQDEDEDGINNKNKSEEDKKTLTCLIRQMMYHPPNAMHSDTESKKKLLEIIAKPNIKEDEATMTRLLNAAFVSRNLDHVRILIDAGAKPDNKTLNCAIMSGHPRLFDIAVTDLQCKPNRHTASCALLNDDPTTLTTVIDKLEARFDAEHSLNCAFYSNNPDQINMVAMSDWTWADGDGDYTRYQSHDILVLVYGRCHQVYCLFFSYFFFISSSLFFYT